MMVIKGGDLLVLINLDGIWFTNIDTCIWSENPPMQNSHMVEFFKRKIASSCELMSSKSARL